MATTRLALYNIALFACGERSIADLNEDREPKRLLDEIWNRGSGAAGGTVRYCLEQGLWDHATRSVLMDDTASVQPPFGFTYAFDRPDDFVRLVDISGDEHFGDGLFHYAFEGGYIYVHQATFYLKYVSDDTDYGGDLSHWPETFSLWVGHWMATQLAPRLKSDIDLDRLEERAEKLLVSARLKETARAIRPWPPIRPETLDHRQLDYALEMSPLRKSQPKEEK